MNNVRSAEDLNRDPADIGKVDPNAAFMDEPVRSNDVAALKKKALADKVKALQEENDLRAVLATTSGVRFMARLIAGPCGWNAPYFHPSNSMMSEIAGRRSIGYQMENWICDVDLSLWFKVRSELEETRIKPKTSERKG
jgi:hypothetical protein